MFTDSEMFKYVINQCKKCKDTMEVYMIDIKSDHCMSKSGHDLDQVLGSRPSVTTKFLYLPSAIYYLLLIRIQTNNNP